MSQMTELESFGRFTGEARKAEPRPVHVSCTHHPQLNATVMVCPDEHISVCCICATVDALHTMQHFGGFGPEEHWGIVLL